MRLVAASVVVLAVAAGCGVGGGQSGAPTTPRVTEADVQFERGITLADALAMCERHDVRPTQVVSRTQQGSSGVMIDPGMGEEDIAQRFREGGESGDVLVNEMFATGDSVALQSLKDEPTVEHVFLKPEGGRARAILKR